MKKHLITTLAAGLLASVSGLQAADAPKETKAAKAKPYPLATCVVSDEKLGGHGKPYVFTHEDQEVKLCCKGCLKDFKKESAKHLKKIETAAKAAKK